MADIARSVMAVIVSEGFTPGHQSL
jgi:hypothetical protein